MIDTSAAQVQYECYTNDTRTTRVKNFDFDNDTSKNIFSHPYIWQVEDYNERNNFILQTAFEMPNAFEKCTTKSELFNGKSYIKKLYTKL